MRFLRFWWDFVVGDDWRAALGVVVALGATAALVAAGVNAWWLMPVGVAAVLRVRVHDEAGAVEARGACAAPDVRDAEVAHRDSDDAAVLRRRCDRAVRRRAGRADDRVADREIGGRRSRAVRGASSGSGG